MCIKVDDSLGHRSCPESGYAFSPYIGTRQSRAQKRIYHSTAYSLLMQIVIRERIHQTSFFDKDYRRRERFHQTSFFDEDDTRLKTAIRRTKTPSDLFPRRRHLQTYFRFCQERSLDHGSTRALSYNKGDFMKTTRPRIHHTFFFQ